MTSAPKQVGHVVVAHALRSPRSGPASRAARPPSSGWWPGVAGPPQYILVAVDGQGGCEKATALRGEAHCRFGGRRRRCAGRHPRRISGPRRHRSRKSSGPPVGLDGSATASGSRRGQGGRDHTPRRGTSKDHSARSMPAIAACCSTSLPTAHDGQAMDGPANGELRGRARARATPRRPRRAARVEVRHHAVLPDQHPSSSQTSEEVRVLVDRGAGTAACFIWASVRQGDRGGGTVLVLAAGERTTSGGTHRTHRQRSARRCQSSEPRAGTVDGDRPEIRLGERQFPISPRREGERIERLGPLACAATTVGPIAPGPSPTRTATHVVDAHRERCGRRPTWSTTAEAPAAGTA